MKERLLEARLIWRRNWCKEQFSVSVGTIFEASTIAFSKWLTAMSLIANAKKGFSSCEVVRELKVAQKTTWFILHRITLAFQHGSLEKLTWTNKADEKYQGCKEANKHFVKCKKEGGGEARVFLAYRGLNWEYTPEVSSHVKSHVRGQVHSKRLENFWGLVKQTVKGSYICASPWRLTAYCDELMFRYSKHQETAPAQFYTVLSHVVGSPLNYAELTGKMCEAR